MKYEVIHSQIVGGFIITLEQKLRKGRTTIFAVQYGLQRKESLQYYCAAKEYGESLMHALACEGLLVDES